MSTLRLMTFNVQLMHPTAPAGNEAVDRANRIVQALTALPEDERPDLIAFNEAFNEDGKAVLVQGLESTWPHYVRKLDTCPPDVHVNVPPLSGLEDSGLMLFSRLPFLDLPTSLEPIDGIVTFRRFADAEGSDRLACKGVGLVQVVWFDRVVTVAFTHLQAFYEREDEHRDIRACQLETIAGLLDDTLGSDVNAWASIVVMGDLNIRGDLGAKTDEWASAFALGSGRFATHLDDGWRTFLHPPSDPPTRDLGYTNNNLVAGAELPVGLLTRLDYQLFGRGPDRRLVPQQMMLRFRHLSDHVSLESHAHQITPHCSPSDAILPAWGSALAGLVAVDARIAFPGSYQWIYVEEPGTYSLFAPPQIDLELYAVDDLSTPLGPVDATEVTLMGVEGLEDAWHELGLDLDPRGLVYAPRGPFFVRLRAGRDDLDWTGAFRTGLFRHRGETPATAIVLHPNADPLDPHLPLNQPLGAEDLCWFRAQIASAHSQKPHTSTFYVDNYSGDGAELTLLTDQFALLDSTGGLQPRLELSHTTPGPQTVYLKLRREHQGQVAFRTGWRQGLTFLRDDRSIRPMVLRCLDETGTDILGADEIRLKLYADDLTVPYFEAYWDDFDTDEAQPLAGRVPEIAFVDRVKVEINEEEDILPEGPGVGYVLKLTDLEPDFASRQADIKVQTGEYRFEYTVAKLPR